MTIVTLRAATVAYGPVRALDGVDLHIESGEAVAIVGPSGSGKTTLLRVVTGLVLVDGGSVEVDGCDLSRADERRRSALRANAIGFVFQDYNLLPYLTALQNVEVSARLRRGGVSPTDALHDVGLAHRHDHLPHELSGGEQQRVAIARAICGSPRIIVADEPTGALDDVTGAEIVELLTGLNRDHGITLVVVTHDERVARRMGRTVRMESGRVLGDER